MNSTNRDVRTTAGAVEPRAEEPPLVSIICFCKDRAATIRRCIESVLSQSYRNLEFVVQDGASTDGTLEILRSYRDDRIKIVSAQDSGPAEAFWKVMNRCRGEFIGTCLSDEELLPGAIEKAVELFRANPDTGAITCDGFVTDTDGKIIDEFNAGEFNMVDYLFDRYCPFWPGSFFRRQALCDVGLGYHQWNIECLEFEVWCRLGTQHVVRHFPIRMSKYAVHETQLSNTTKYFHEHFDNRATVIRGMFSAAGFFGDDEVKRNGCLYNQLYLLYNHVKAYRLADQMKMLASRMDELRRSIGLMDRVNYAEYFNFVSDDFAQGKGEQKIFSLAMSIWVRGALSLPAGVRRRIPAGLKRGLRKLLTLALYVAFKNKKLIAWLVGGPMRVLRSRLSSEPPLPAFSKKIHHQVAQIYYARGQIDQALQLWRRAEELNDPVLDGLACQAMLMSSTATYAGLLAVQRRWAELYAKPDPGLAGHAWKPYDGRRKIRVGYFCSFFDSDTIRCLVVSVVHKSECQQIEYYGYSPSPVPDDIADSFEQFRVTGTLSDSDFVKLVRADAIDIFVELSGFSPQHRFAAMASRCAPVQVSYLNHTGTSGVPNVDYVFADPVSVLPGEDRFFTEKVWRLPGCFLCYNYDAYELPPVVAPPYRANGHVTFGCFGSGGKINTQMIELWAQIMQRVPNSRMYIRNGQLTAPDNRQFMIDRFRRFGIGAERLRIEGGTDRNGILASLAEVDISLDTWPYCGGNSIAEPICQGVPVITLKGDRFSGRYGASLMIAAGCPELIADTPERYVEVAVALAGSTSRLDHYRNNLRQMALTHGMSDAAAFAKKLDSAYIQMMERLRDVPAKSGVAQSARLSTGEINIKESSK